MSYIIGIELHNMGPVERIPPGGVRSFRVQGEELTVSRSPQGDVLTVHAQRPHHAVRADAAAGADPARKPLAIYPADGAPRRPVRGRAIPPRTYRIAVSPRGDLLLGAKRREIALCD
jgi:hypothetical protein